MRVCMRSRKIVRDGSEVVVRCLDHLLVLNRNSAFGQNQLALRCPMICKPIVLQNRYDRRMADIDSRHGPITVTEDSSRVRTFFGTAAGVLALSTALGLVSADSGVVREWFALFMSIFIVPLVVFCIYVMRHPARIEVTKESIRFVRRNGREGAVLSRQHAGQYDDEVTITRMRRGRRTMTVLTLVRLTDQVIPVALFSADAIADACHDRSWRLTGRI